MEIDAKDALTSSAHYDADYFEWQASLGMLSGSLNAGKFAPFIRSTDSLLDFGCGGGFLLASLHAARKLGVEINRHARAAAAALRIDTVATLADVPNDSFDIIVSNHALEHTEAPLEIARMLLTKLKPGGLAVVVVPCERYDSAYFPDNVDQHLYTWSPLNLGNLFRHAGFEISSVERVAQRWPPYVEVIDRVLGRAVCDLACKLYAMARPKMTQVRVVARRPS